MAKIFLDRLRKRYNYTGESYKNLIDKIITNNSENISRRIGEISQDTWSKSLNAIKKGKFIIPRVEEVLPKRSVFIIKGANQGKILSDNLRDRLTKNLRDTLNDFTPKTKEPKFLKRRGEERGKINTKLIEEFESRIQETFTNYTKRDKALKMPTNIHEIAVTEMRSSIDSMKEGYVNELKKKNKDTLKMVKTWIHNKSLSKKFRRGHRNLNEKSKPMDEPFKVGLYKRIGKRWYLIRTDEMMRPHDPNASADQVIGCSCEARYGAVEK